MGGVGLKGHLLPLDFSFQLRGDRTPPSTMGPLGEKLLLGKLAAVGVKESQGQGDQDRLNTF